MYAMTAFTQARTRTEWNYELSFRVGNCTVDVKRNQVPLDRLWEGRDIATSSSSSSSNVKANQACSVFVGVGLSIFSLVDLHLICRSECTDTRIWEYIVHS